MTLRRLLYIMLVSTLISIAGVYTAYNGITSSQAWMEWGDDRIWKIDIIRLLYVLLISIFLTRTTLRSRYEELPDHYKFKFDLLNISIIVFCILIVTYLNFIYYPPNFCKEILQSVFVSEETKLLVKQNYFDQIYKPYFFYFFYTICLWMGIIAPTFSIFVKGFIIDYKKTRKIFHEIKRFDVSKEFKKIHKKKPDLKSIKRLLSIVEDYRVRYEESLRDLVQRYAPMILLVFIGHSTNVIYTSSGLDLGNNRELANTMTEEARSSYNWIVTFYLIVCLIFAYYFAKVLSNFFNVIEKKLNDLRNYVERNKYSFEYKNEIRVREKQWTLKEINIFIYLWNKVFKTRSIYLPFLIFVSIIVWQSIIKGNIEWLLPKEIIDFIQDIFIRDIDGNR